MKRDTLLICGEERHVPDDSSAVVISKEISQIDPNEANELFARLITLDVAHGFDVPVYSILSNQVWNSPEYHDDSPDRLELLIPLYCRLRSYIDDNTTHVRCIGVSDLYLDFIIDFTNNEGLILEYEGSSNIKSYHSIVGRCCLWLFFSIIDILASLMVSLTSSSSGTNVLVKYPTFRPETFRPIESRLGIPFDATFTLLTVSYLRYARSVPEADTNTIPIRAYDTLYGMVGDYPKVAHIYWDLFIGDRIISAAVDAVEQETDIRLEATIKTIIRRVALENPSDLLYYGTADRLFSSGKYSCLLVTSLGPSGKLLTLAANKHDVQTLSLGHSITLLPGVANRQFIDTTFIEGEIATRLADEELAKTFISTGYPKHVNALKESDENNKSNQNKTILIGTQPYADRYRERFISDVVPTIIKRTDWGIVLKLHPAESLSYYKNILKSMGYDSSNHDRISVVDNDLYDWIQKVDFLMTINSNVGIEAVILGTPAVCYNPWVHIRDPPYASHGVVPKLTNPDELVDFLTEFDFEEHQQQQQSLIEGPYDVVGNSLDQIAEQIETELMKCGNSNLTVTNE